MPSTSSSRTLRVASILATTVGLGLVSAPVSEAETPTAGAAKRTYSTLKAAGLTVQSASLKSRTLRVKVTATKPLALRFAIVRGTKQLGSAKISVPKGTTSLKLLLNQKSAGKNLRLRVTARSGNRRGRQRVGVGLIALPKPQTGAQGTPVTPNRPPTALALTGGSVAENAPAGSTVGNVQGTDPDAADTLTYGFAAGAGDTDNAAFTLSSGTLRTAAPFDFEARSSYSVRLQVADGRGGTFEQAFVVSVTDVNEAPSALGLSSASVSENQAVGTPVGTFSASDPDAGDGRTFSLVPGTGDADNGSFAVVGTELRTAATFDKETKGTYSVRARVTDTAGATDEKTFSITVTDVNDAPTDIAISSADVPENRPSGTAVGTLSATDQDAGATHAFTLVAGAGSTDNGSFAIVGGVLRTAASFDYETDASYSVRVQADDGAGGTFAKALTIDVTDVDDPAVAVDDSATVTEDDAATAVPVLVNDSDQDDPLSIASATDPANGTVAITGGGTGLTYRPDADYCGASDTFTYTLGGTSGGTATVTMTVTCVNDAPAVTTTAGPLAYTEQDPATPVDPAVVVVDPDSQIASATVVISTGLAAEDVLAYTAPSGNPVTAGAYVPATGTLTLTGPATPAQFSAALRAVTYRNTSSNPSLTTRTVTFNATDGTLSSADATRDISISATDNAPDVDTSAGSLAYTENDAATAIDTAITVTDVDSANLTGATVRITGGYVGTQDVLSYTAPGGNPVTAGAFDTGTGTLTLSGTATVAEYEAALEAVAYENSSDDPDTGARTVTYAARDAGGFGLSDTHGITMTAVDDDPAAVDDTATVGEDAAATPVTVLANDTDVDAGPISIASVTPPANGAVAITGGGSGLTYAPDADYCNTPPGTTPDTFTYTLDGGSTATVSVTVTCVDDAPGAVDDTATVAEDSGATAVDVLANDTDVDAGPRAVSAVTPPANGSVAITGGGTGVNYTPDANFCSATPDTFTYTLSPGTSTATVSITVTCVDDDPDAVDDADTVGEDSAANVITVLANDTDVDGGPKAVASVTDPANGTTANNGTDVSYTPDPDYCNSQAGGTPDTFSYTLTPGGATATVSVTVSCGGDAPAVNTTAGALAYTENGPATPIDTGVTVTDADVGATITGATVEITGNPAAGDEIALGNPLSHPLITPTVVGATLTLAGTASPAEYQAALRDVTYRSTSENPSTLARTVTFQVTDDTALSGSDTRGIAVTTVDDSPTAMDDSATVAEDSGAAAVPVLTNDTDVDGGPISITAVTPPANGVVTITGGGSGLTYAPNADFCSPTADTFTYTLSPGGSTATVSMTVTCVNDVPVVDTSSGTLGYTENDAATAIDPAVTVTDADADALITGATVAITANFAAGQDLLALSGVHGLITAGSQVGNTLTLSGTASVAAYQAALRAVTYANSSEGPSLLTRTVTFTVTDNTALSGSDTRVITVTGVNDPPTAVDDSGTTDEDTTLNVAAPGVLANDTDVDPGDTKTVDRLNGTGTLTQTLPSGASVTINANGSYSYDPQSAFQGLSTGQTASDSFTYRMTDGGGDSSTATVSITINGVSDAPVAVSDSFDVIGNTGLFVGTAKPTTQAGKVLLTGSVLDNDTDPDTPQASLVVEPVTNAPTTLGGTITVEADGNFTYQPDDGDTGVTDTFTYRVCDASPCTSGTVANATGTLSLPIDGQVWYVRNNAAAGGDGTSDTPFDTLAEAETASGTGDTTYVFDGANTTANLDTGYVMNANERLIGESRPLTLDPDGAGPLGTASLFGGTAGAQPTLAASNEDVVVLAAGAVVDGVDLDPSGTGGGLFGGTGTSAVTVSNVNVTDTGTAATQPGIELDGTTGTNRFEGVTATNGGSATAIGVRLNNAGTVNFANTATNTITTTGAKALDAAGTNLATSQWNDITVTGSGTGGVRLSSTTGSVKLGDGSGTDLSLQTTSGATAALDISSSNSVTVDTAGTDTISATGGPAVDIRNSNGSTFTFDSVSSTNSASDGINLDTNLTSPFTAAAGAIGGAAGIAVDVNGGGSGGGTVSYAGAINDGAGVSAEVTGRDGGSVTLSGNIADGADAGGGITVSGNSGGSVAFSGASKVLNTGTGTAISMSSNSSGASLAFTGGGLDIDTTSGTGLDAGANGATLEVSGTGNSIATTTGRALNVTSTPISANELTFQSIAANGAPNGIVLSTTGSAGGLEVTGNGGACATTADACTGGTIQSTTGDAISLTSSQKSSLVRMKVLNNAGNGIRGAAVTDFALRNSVIDNNGDDAATDEAGLHFTNLAGTAAFTNLLVANSPEDNARIVNSSGTLTQLDVLDSTFRDTDTVSPGNNGLLIQADGGSITADVLGNQFLRNRANGLQVVTNSTGSMNVEVDDSGTTQSTFDDNNIGVNIAHNSSGSFRYDVRDLTIDGLNVAPGTGGSASPININRASAATSDMVGTVTGNTLTNSNSTTGPGISMRGNGVGTMTSLIQGNTISQVANRGIEVIARDGSNRINATIADNSVTLNNALAGDAIRVDAGAVSGDTATVCADIRGNTATTTAVGLFGIRIRQRFSTTYLLENYGGGGADDAAVQTYLGNRNNVASTSADRAAGGVFTTTAECPNP